MPKNPHKLKKSIADDVATIILAGGQGTRLYPLTKARCKPNVCFGGRYRLIDIPISNSLNSGIEQIYIISQYFSSGLNHHIKETFSLDNIQGAMIENLYPEETLSGTTLYKGTADAIRNNIAKFEACICDYFLILSGDQLYNINFYEMIKFAKKHDADLTIASICVQEDDATRMGLLRLDDEHKILDFYEKPTDAKVLKNYQLDKSFLEKNKQDPLIKSYLGSMGIYLFKKEVLIDLLTKDPREDFGKHLIPTQIEKGRSYAYIYNGYWEDIGTIKSFYLANLALTTNKLGLDLYDETFPIFANVSHLPSARITDTNVKDSILSQGSIIEAKEINSSMIGLRSLIRSGTVIRNSIILGNQFYSPPSSLENKLPKSFQIGKNCHIENTIIDEHVHIGSNVTLTNEKNVMHYDGDGIYIRDGIIVVSSGVTIPDNYTL